MIDGSEKVNRQLAFEIQNSHVCEKRSNVVILIGFRAIYQKKISHYDFFRL